MSLVNRDAFDLFAVAALGRHMDATPTRRLDLDRSVTVLLNFLSNRLTSTGSALYRSRFGLSITEFRLLVMLAVEPDIAPARICEVMGLDAGLASRSLRALERRGLVRSRADKRNPAYGRWSLTEDGAHMQDEAVEFAVQRDAILLEAINPQEQELLVSMLRRMLESVDRLRALR